MHQNTQFKIPKQIHFIWVTPQNNPSQIKIEHIDYLNKTIENNKNFDFYLWTQNKDLIQSSLNGLKNQVIAKEISDFSEDDFFGLKEFKERFEPMDHLVDELKLEVLTKMYKKYTLTELEEKC
jgi:hypothetical protein